MRQKPGPDVHVADRAPVRAAPIAIVTAAISSSVCITRTEPASWATSDSASAGSRLGVRVRTIWFASMYSLSSEAGLIGEYVLAPLPPGDFPGASAWGPVLKARL